MEKPTKSESGFPTADLLSRASMQTKWRMACGVAVLVAGGMAWYGAESVSLRRSLATFAAYWGVFLVLIGIIFFIVLLDLRYIRLQYVIARRELYRQAFEDEEFRKALLGATEKRAGGAAPENAEEKIP